MNLERLDDIKINFIIGHGRSGTTMLVLILNQHPNCIATPEMAHFIYFYKKYKDVSEVTQNLIDDYRAYLKVVFNSKKSMFLKAYDDTFLNILKVGEEINYGRLTKLIYLSFFENKKDIETINCIVDKNPYYTFHINKVLGVFPDAKMLVMVRDYRGYILSNRQSQNAVIVKKSVAYYAVAWNYYIKNILRIDKRNSGQVKLMRYEDLVEHRQREVKSIVEFFGLKFSNDLLNFQEALKSKIKGMNLIGRKYEHLLKRLEALSAPINSSRASEWVVKLTMAEKEHADCISSGYGAEIGYSGVTKISNLKRLFYQLKTIPAYIRVGIFFRLNSPKLFYYLNVKNKLQKEKNS